MNRLCAQVLGTGRPLAVCAPRDLKLRISQYLVLIYNLYILGAHQKPVSMSLEHKNKELRPNLE